MLGSVANMIPLVGPTASGMLHGLARVCEAAARFRANDKEALRLMERVAQVTDKVLVSHAFLREEDAERASKTQADVEQVLEAVRLIPGLPISI